MATQILTGRERPFVPATAYTTPAFSTENLVKLCASAIFAGLSQRELTEILSCARMRTFTRDELLYSQGQAARNLIVLQTGTVKHTQLSSSGDEVLLRMSGTGEALNLNAGPSACNHSCSARATEQCRAWVWEYNKLQEMLERYPQLRANITQVISSHLRELEERFREVATEKVARRLALILIRLMKQIGTMTAEGTQVSLRREDLAQMTGTTLFTISRIISKWADLGLVVPKREAVVIVDGKRLETESEYDI